jgi:AcrR family transcriptional regulator
MSQAVACEGYAAATIAQVIAHAGVSRPTFYDYFADKDDCFVAALVAIQERLTTDIREAMLRQAPEHATHAAVATLVGFADSQPLTARALMNEALAGRQRALDVRDHGIAAIEQTIEEQYTAVDPATAVPDLPARALIGGIYRLLASRLRTSEQQTAGLLEDLLVWIKHYEHPLREHRWRTLHPTAPLVPSPVVETPLRAPMRLGPGRTRLSKQEVAENHRQRILVAAARLSEEKGYTAITISDITRDANVDTRSFYRLFADKREAFCALHDLLFRHIMAVTAAGFLAGKTWPERVWEAGRAFAQYMEQNPTLAYATFVDSHAGDAHVVQRVQELVNGFTIFLREGYQYKPGTRPPSSLALEAIAATMFELDYSQVRQSLVRRLSGLVPHFAFISLAPFIGPAEANKVIHDKLKAQPASR